MSAANSSPNSAELGAGRRVEVNNSDITAPMVSAATSLLYCAHKENGDYQYVGLDWMTGALRERWTFPDDSRLWNAFGGITTIVEDGGTSTAVARVRTASRVSASPTWRASW